MALRTDCDYMASWDEEDRKASSLKEAMQYSSPVWVYWDGTLAEDQPPPCRVMMLSTKVTYTWEQFQKVRSNNG